VKSRSIKDESVGEKPVQVKRKNIKGKANIIDGALLIRLSLTEYLPEKSEKAALDSLRHSVQSGTIYLANQQVELQVPRPKIQ
jgi:PHD/YefM family antitoxin component YafN of YafNO toxin-antitoxin module